MGKSSALMAGSANYARTTYGDGWIIEEVIPVTDGRAGERSIEIYVDGPSIILPRAQALELGRTLVKLAHDGDSLEDEAITTTARKQRIISGCLAIAERHQEIEDIPLTVAEVLKSADEAELAIEMADTRLED